MRQRYLISKEGTANNLIIREYCVIDKNLQHTKKMEPIQDDYALMYQEEYDDSAIRNAIPKGLDALIAALRTANLFPIEPNAVKIAESVMVIYGSSDARSMDLFFDDVELFAAG